ncbi:hypothetical protein McpAg1_09770 [Methanocorpusculaceae archaeon Ag1]|uniref:Uncharacterized protein n=1 Tax=Methanorbis furvi TaxID=3028299 RepID=A0AAE4S9G2_9EURY|nr:hypothetical protein [Methanocorpusculaceae archaeon Ag1]
MIFICETSEIQCNMPNMYNIFYRTYAVFSNRNLEVLWSCTLSSFSLSCMTRSKTTDLDYIHFLISEYCSFSCCEAERCLHYDSRHPYHDSFGRLLEERTPQHTEALWKDVGPFVSLTGGYLTSLTTLLWTSPTRAPSVPLAFIGATNITKCFRE